MRDAVAGDDKRAEVALSPTLNVLPTSRRTYSHGAMVTLNQLVFRSPLKLGVCNQLATKLRTGR